MPATIRITKGVGAGSIHWIEQRMIRIGSDHHCEIVLPSLEISPHALSLEYRAGGYRVHNRGRDLVTLGGQAIPAGGSAPWPPGQSVDLGRDVSMVLAVEADPAPGPAPRPGLEDTPDDGAAAGAPAASAPPAKKKKHTLELAVILVCTAAVFGLLALSRSPATKASAGPTLEALVLGAAQADPETVGFLRRVQEAERAMIRGHKADARARFTTIKNDLLDAVAAEPKPTGPPPAPLTITRDGKPVTVPRTTLARLAAFVESRLAAL